MATFTEMAAERDSLYAATLPEGAFALALTADSFAAMLKRPSEVYKRFENINDRDALLLRLALKALKNDAR